MHGKAPLFIVPRDVQTHELMLTIIESFPIVFVERKYPVRTRVNPQRQGAVGRLARVLLHWAHGNHSPSADVKRYGLQIHLAGGLAPTFDLFPGPKIIPSAARKVESA